MTPPARAMATLAPPLEPEALELERLGSIETKPVATAPRWIEARPGLPYFVTEDGDPWTPIGQNDAVGWPDLAGLFRRRDVAAVERHLRWLKAHGVTCLRLMLEYCQAEHRYIERPIGTFQPNMLRFWDDLFALLEEIGLHVLLTPADTFFMWIRWKHHPYNRRNGGPCAGRNRLITCPATRAAIKDRLAFATDRWGASPALFAWDLWNEIHPAHGGDDPAACAPFIEDVGGWLRAHEIARHGRAHLQTVSMFGPVLLDHPQVGETMFRSATLDFATIHLYEKGTIDDPRDTVAPARAVGRLMRGVVRAASDLRPVLDTEHGPIHRFLDRRVTLPEGFDDEYFRHIQWAHLASGGAGGGMRWPNRHPHVLTHGMRAAQASLAAFLPLIDWASFRRRNLSEEVRTSDGRVACFACGDEAQAVLWLLRGDTVGKAGRVDASAEPLPVALAVPGLAAGRYRLTSFDTATGTIAATRDLVCRGGDPLETGPLPVTADLALAIRRL